MHPAPFTTKRIQRPHLLVKWFRKMLPDNDPEIERVHPRERRTAFRFTFAASDSLSVHIKFRTFQQLSIPLYDLSAGGFTCILPQSLSLKIGDQVRLSLTLPLEKQLFIEGQARLLGTIPGKENDAPLHRFKFNSSLTERNRDHIHHFILKKQLDLIRKS